jgi:hypothetical protein
MSHSTISVSAVSPLGSSAPSVGARSGGGRSRRAHQYAIGGNHAPETMQLGCGGSKAGMSPRRWRRLPVTRLARVSETYGKSFIAEAGAAGAQSPKAENAVRNGWSGGPGSNVPQVSEASGERWAVDAGSAFAAPTPTKEAQWIS